VTKAPRRKVGRSKQKKEIFFVLSFFFFPFSFSKKEREREKKRGDFFFVTKRSEPPALQPFFFLNFVFVLFFNKKIKQKQKKTLVHH
jgi:hypothetical protein